MQEIINMHGLPFPTLSSGPCEVGEAEGKQASQQSGGAKLALPNSSPTNHTTTTVTKSPVAP